MRIRAQGEMALRLPEPTAVVMMLSLTSPRAAMYTRLLHDMVLSFPAQTVK